MIKMLFANILAKKVDFLAIVLIYILTFPTFSIDYGIGLDASYIWAFNHLFAFDYHTVSRLVFPFGPLTLLKNPTADWLNFEIFLIFFTFTKLLFCYKLISFNRYISISKYWLYLIVFLTQLSVQIDFYIIFLSFIYSFEFLQHKRYYSIAIAGFISFVGLSIKSSIGVSAFSVVFIAHLLSLLEKRDIAFFLKSIAVTILSVYVPAIIIFKSFLFPFTYFYNVLMLSSGYSSALSYFSKNNWLVLSLFIATILSVPFLFRRATIRNAFWLLLPVSFALWKHSFVRQDFTHNSLMFYYLFYYWAVFLILSESKKQAKIIALIAIFSVSLYYRNMSYFWNYEPKRVEINGINNFAELLFDFTEFKEKQKNISDESIKKSKLPDTVLNIIGTRTVDSYPWELSYFSANSLNWKPRTILQNSSFSRWLDDLNAQDFSLVNGPDFLIVHSENDQWNGKFGSIDNRYLLNDNPISNIALFGNYSLKYKDEEILLFEKTATLKLAEVVLSKTEIADWNEWISVSPNNGEILRLKVQTENSVLGSFKNFIYKKEEYYVDYQLSNGKVFSYRFITENAVDGLWVHPLIRFPNTEYIEAPVSKVRLRCSNQIFNKSSFDYQVEKIKIRNNNVDSINNNVYSLFGKSKTTHDTIVFALNEGFDNLETNSINGVNINSQNYFQGIGSNEVSGGGFSYTFTIPLDSLWLLADTAVNTLYLEAELMHLNQNSDAKLVINITETDADVWAEQSLSKTNSGNNWLFTAKYLELKRQNSKQGTLKVFVWNYGKKPVYIDNFNLFVIQKQEK
ncbi:MAG: hypothetical protein IPO21_04180 [Bacteroidales bacterium]|nr:hypothetical protein [Bacteroidales bacterium]